MPRSHPLPLIPELLLDQHQVQQPGDGRFRSCARLLQALFRQRLGLAAGRQTTRRGGTRVVGSLLTQNDAAAGRNFLSADIARLARLSLIYRQPGALIHEQRLFANLLSSQPLAFNLFGPFALDLDLARRVLRFILPDAGIYRVLGVTFEHSPGRRHGELTGDSSAFDVAIAYERRDGMQGFIGIEVKYSEDLASAPPACTQRYNDIAEASAIFKEPASALLRYTNLRQLAREHLLAQVALIRGDWSEAHFILIAPGMHAAITRAANLYAGHLSRPLPGIVPFHFMSLEQAIAAIERAGAAEHAAALHHRYTDWSKIDRLVASFVAGDVPSDQTLSMRPPRLEAVDRA